MVRIGGEREGGGGRVCRRSVPPGQGRCWWEKKEEERVKGKGIVRENETYSGCLFLVEELRIGRKQVLSEEEMSSFGYCQEKI